MIKKTIKTIRTRYINFGYRHKCSKIYWVIYLMFNLLICLVYRNVLMIGNIWMYEKHFLGYVQKFEVDFFNNRKHSIGKGEVNG